MSVLMSFRARRELLSQVDVHATLRPGMDRSRGSLYEFLASTGYARKYADPAVSARTLSTVGADSSATGAAVRTGPCERHCGLPGRRSMGLCAKRLVPFLPELVRPWRGTATWPSRPTCASCSSRSARRRWIASYGRYGGLTGWAPPTRERLLKHQVPVRTFSDWSDLKPGFFEGDLVAHCGVSATALSSTASCLPTCPPAGPSACRCWFRGEEAV